MFTSLIVATDIEAGPDRALGAATSLARRRGLPVEVLTVVRGDDVATAIVDHVRNRDGALLTMTTGATGLLSGLRRTVTGEVLAELRQPVLLLGPKVPDRLSLAAPTLVAGVDPTREAAPALPVIESWLRTFGGPRPWIVDVIATAAWPAGTIEDAVEREQVDATVDVLATHGIDAAAKVLHGGDPVCSLLDFAEEVDDAVFVTTSDRWAGGRSHWYSTTRRLVERSHRPVLVVAGDMPGYCAQGGAGRPRPEPLRSNGHG